MRRAKPQAPDKSRLAGGIVSRKNESPGFYNPGFSHQLILSKNHFAIQILVLVTSYPLFRPSSWHYCTTVLVAGILITLQAAIILGVACRIIWVCRGCAACSPHQSPGHPWLAEQVNPLLCIDQTESVCRS